MSQAVAKETTTISAQDEPTAPAGLEAGRDATGTGRKNATARRASGGKSGRQAARHRETPSAHVVPSPVAPAIDDEARFTGTGTRGLTFERRWTRPGTHPYDEVTWEYRTANISNESGKTVFEQTDVEVPSFWSQLATNVVVSKYFRGHVGTPQREHSVKQLIDRVVNTITAWAETQHYFATAEDLEAFKAELTHLLLHQKMAFNSPVWFNVGVEERPQCSACFINSVQDNMGSIMDLAKTEAMLFKYGSGAGVNLSPIRGSKERMSGGGIASGPVSFMKGYDAFAGVVKSGGKTRRAAKMVILNADHPDVLDFIDSKANEERKAWALIEQGYDPSFTGEAYASVFFQNANHSVRVTDDFMHAIERDAEWQTHEVTTGQPAGTFKARSIFRRMADAAWICGDPGIQYDTTINDWNPVANTDRQYATNPCSEFSFINDTSCNLSSLNLMKFVDSSGEFDIDAFKYACRLAITAQEVLVDNAGYPTPMIEANSHRFRPLGLGYANLGALLMSRGLAYDSPDGQAYAATLTAIMTGEAYRQSAMVARDHGGPFNDYALNEAPFLRVIGKHRDAAYAIPEVYAPRELIEAARSTWDQALELGTEHGYRNAQVTVLAPTGCLVGGSLVTTDRGLVRLRSLGNPDGDKWQSLDLKVGTDDGPRDATKFYVNGAEPVVTVKTNRGYRIQGTTMHRIKVVDTNGDWQWRRFSDVRAGDRVPLMLGGLIGEPRDVALPPLAENAATEWSLHAPPFVDADVAELAGYLIGGGSVDPEGLRFLVDSQDPDVVDRITELGRRLFSVDATVARGQDTIEVSFDSTVLADWWTAAGFRNGREPQIPSDILATNDPQIYRAFVHGLFDSNSSISKGHAYWWTSSEDFAHEVQSLLLALGCDTALNGHLLGSGHLGANPLFVLRLADVGSPGRFVEEIGFASSRKREGIARALADRLPMRAHAATGDGTQTAIAVLERTAPADRAGTFGYVYDEVASAELGEEQLTYDISVPSNVTYVANGFVSHNTIAFMMDCDTTGIEPDIALVKYKKLVGEGFLKIVNQTVPGALKKLGYTPAQVEEIVHFINERETIEGAPGLRPEHLPVFDCAFKPVNGERSIQYMGHVRMMGAVQPFLSGAISKTVNMPEAATAEDIEDVYLQGWKLGLKAIAIYRDGSKRSQPLSTGKKKDSDAKVEVAAAPVAGPTGEPKPYRRRLPDERAAITHKFQVAGHEGYITVGLYPDGQPGEIFLKMAKEGSTVSGLMDTMATMTSIALQYGVPLRDLVNKFSHVRFEPAGFTGQLGDPDRKVDRRLRVPLAGLALPLPRREGRPRDHQSRGDPAGSLVERGRWGQRRRWDDRPRRIAGRWRLDRRKVDRHDRRVASADRRRPDDGRRNVTGPADGRTPGPGERAGQREWQRARKGGPNRDRHPRRPDAASRSRSAPTRPRAPTAARSWCATAAATSASTAAARAGAAEVMSDSDADELTP